MAVIAFFLCRSVVVKGDQCDISGYKIVEFSSKEFPMRGKGVIFAEMDSPGELTVHLIHNADSHQPIEPSNIVDTYILLPGKEHARSGFRSVECQMRFPHPGHYFLVLKCDGEEVSRYPVDAVKSS